MNEFSYFSTLLIQSEILLIRFIFYFLRVFLFILDCCVSDVVWIYYLQFAVRIIVTILVAVIYYTNRENP